jgi:tripartite-type tricarboxylate transporter receptor subunit TctC
VNGNKKMTAILMSGYLRKALLVCCLSLVGGVAVGTAPAAADYPNRPVKWLIGFAAGGPVDILARIMSQWLSDHFGKQFVGENRAGSGGQYRSRRRDQLATRRLHAFVRRAQQRDLDLAVQEATV